jgi:hypothetical protein
MSCSDFNTISWEVWLASVAGEKCTFFARPIFQIQQIENIFIHGTSASSASGSFISSFQWLKRVLDTSRPSPPVRGGEGEIFAAKFAFIRGSRFVSKQRVNLLANFFAHSD